MKPIVFQRRNNKTPCKLSEAALQLYNSALKAGAWDSNPTLIFFKLLQDKFDISESIRRIKIRIYLVLNG